MDNKEIVEILVKLVEAFESLGISYHVGGSVVSSFYGEWRVTDDIDIIADIQLSSVNRLVQKLEDEFYIDADMIRDAIRRKSSFNVIYLASSQKADIFIRKSHSFAQQEYLRSRPEIIAEGTRPFLLASPEDTILNKLDWYKMGNGTMFLKLSNNKAQSLT